MDLNESWRRAVDSSLRHEQDKINEQDLNTSSGALYSLEPELSFVNKSLIDSRLSSKFSPELSDTLPSAPILANQLAWVLASNKWLQDQLSSQAQRLARATQLNSSLRQVIKVQKTINSSTTSFDTALSSLLKQHDRIVRIENELSTALNPSSSKDQNLVRLQLGRTMHANQALKTSLENAESRHKSSEQVLSTKLKESEARIITLETELTLAKNQIDDLETISAEAKASAAKLRLQNAELNSTVTQLAEKTQGKTQQCKQLMGLVSELEGSKTSLQEEVQTIEEEKAELELQLKHLSSRLNGLGHLVSEMQLAQEEAQLQDALLLIEPKNETLAENLPENNNTKKKERSNKKVKATKRASAKYQARHQAEIEAARLKGLAKKAAYDDKSSFI